MASEVISDIKIELFDLNYLCYHVYLASKGLHELNDTYNNNEEIYHPLTCVASPQVKTGSCHGLMLLIYPSSVGGKSSVVVRAFPCCGFV